MTTQTPFPQFPPAFLARFADEVLSAVSLQPMAADGIARLQQLASTAVLVQRLAVLLQGTQLPARQSVALDTAMHRALEKIGTSHANAGGTISTELHGVDLWMDPEVLDLILDIALQWAAGIGRKISVRISFARGSGHPYLVLNVHDTHDTHWREKMKDEERYDNLRWMMIRILAQSQLLDPQRVIVNDSAVIVLRFPEPTVNASAEGMQTVVLPPQQIKPGAMAGGCHILIVEPDAQTRLTAEQVLHDAGMLVKAYASARAATDGAHDFVVEALVCGLPADDPEVILLVGTLHQRNPGLRVIQLTDEDCLYIGEDVQLEAARVGRESVSQVLLTAVNLALEVFGPATSA